MQAERNQNPRSLFDALESAGAALRLEPRNPAARFNQAVALDRLALDEQAADAWRAYLEVDHGSGWAGAARHRIRELVRSHLPALPQPGARADEVLEYAESNSPQEIQLLGWEQLLDEWGKAVIQADEVRAEDRLRVAERLAESLRRRVGDTSLTDEVRSIRTRNALPEARLRLAQAHVSYSAARRAHRRGEYEAADTLFDRVLRTTDVSLPLHRWAQVFHGSTQAYRRGPRAGEPDVRGVLRAVDAKREPSLVGRARWYLGTMLLRQNQLPAAEAEYEEAVRLFARAGESENLGAVLYLAGVVRHRLGDSAGAYTRIHRSLLTLRRYRASQWLHGALYQEGEIVAGDGMQVATQHILDEDNQVVARTGIPVYVAEARITRARVMAQSGRRDRLTADIAAGTDALEKMPLGLARSWLTRDLLEARAAQALPGSATHAAALLDTAIAEWEQADIAVRVLPALLARAEARLAMGDIASAEADLRDAATRLEHQWQDTANVRSRAMLLDARRVVFDRLIMLRLRAGRSDEALAYLERSRASFAPRAWEPAERTGVHLPPRAGETALDYTLIGDTLLVWTIRGREALLTRTLVDSAQFLSDAERARSLLELRADERVSRPVLQSLYEVLVRPVERWLSPADTLLVVVADGEISGVPFAALFDARHGRYFVERYQSRFAATLADARRAAPARPARASRALLVTDPAFDPAEHPLLGRLSGAADEALDVLGRLYPHPSVLRGAEASPGALLAALPHAEVFHYAGHALFDDENPERSVLVLAPGHGGARHGLSADSIGRLKFPELRLVVLSACETLRSRSGRSGGFAGLAGAFLAARAGGVIGSLWLVDDEATRPLAAELHRAYARSSNGAGALRQAQLWMLHSKDPALSGPTAWAGFRYAGS